jgi:hypothetical protein
MDFVKFFKKHNEKVLLSVVLTALAAATIYLLVRVSDERQELERARNLDVIVGTKALPTTDIATNEAQLKRLRRPPDLELSGEHNVFNPVTWKQLADGNLIKIITGREIGAGALQILETKPLMLRVSYEGATVRGSQTYHKFKITREAQRLASQRGPMTFEAGAVGYKNDVFTVREVQPSSANPESFVLEMAEGNETITVGVNEPYQGVAGYTVDLLYPPDNQRFMNKRIDDRLVFAGDTNQIVAIEKDSVTVQALSNRKRTTVERESIPDAPAPTP